MTETEGNGTATSSRGRKLFGHPVLLQDWDQEFEHAFQYWELFLDLLLVAAASAVTDQFKENLSLKGLSEFVVFYLVLMNGWMLYTHHITSRYNDNSLVHSLVIFFYIVGFGLAMVNTGYDSDIIAFCWGAILQRACVLLMLVQISICIPRSRHTNSIIGLVTATTTILLFLVILLSTIGQDSSSNMEESPLRMTLLWMAAGVEFFGEPIMTRLLRGNRLVPISIEHTTERFGAMELVCLGETVLSVTIIYREMLAQGEIAQQPQHSYYLVLSFSFLLVFMFLLLYFHMQPSPADHALRRFTRASVNQYHYFRFASGPFR